MHCMDYMCVKSDETLIPHILMDGKADQISVKLNTRTRSKYILKKPQVVSECDPNDQLYRGFHMYNEILMGSSELKYGQTINLQNIIEDFPNVL
ncbi:hypothetical protein TNCT_687431 [Trichonephila clavata]|uniref:Uncharacterized protein n=1 Tax=Trichonephila clavata TaxID=2740835 RepID=A0A8X6J5D9_TRICU|nr:hypothetical protein TNCT_687431 [Trichonephila clavata]